MMGSIEALPDLEEYLDYLDALGESGETNMFAAAPYLAQEFGLTAELSQEVCKHWRQTFGSREGSSE